MPASPPENASAAPVDLILMGSYLEHVTKTDPHSLSRLMKGLDEFLERDRDRELFDLAPNKKNAIGSPD